MPPVVRIFALALIALGPARAVAQDRSTTPDPPANRFQDMSPFPPQAVEDVSLRQPNGTQGLASGTNPGNQPEPVARPQPNSILLKPPGQIKSGSASSSPLSDSGLSSILTVGSSLAVVLGLFFVVAWLMRRATPGASGILPSDVVEVLGRAPLAGRQQIHLLRCGSKLILISVTQDTVETLTEITEPAEVDRLAGLCRQSQPNSTTAAFRQVFQQLAGEQKKAATWGSKQIDRDVRREEYHA